MASWFQQWTEYQHQKEQDAFLRQQFQQAQQEWQQKQEAMGLAGGVLGHMYDAPMPGAVPMPNVAPSKPPSRFDEASDPGATLNLPSKYAPKGAPATVTPPAPPPPAPPPPTAAPPTGAPDAGGGDNMSLRSILKVVKTNYPNATPPQIAEVVQFMMPLMAQQDKFNWQTATLDARMAAIDAATSRANMTQDRIDQRLAIRQQFEQGNFDRRMKFAQDKLASSQTEKARTAAINEYKVVAEERYRASIEMIQASGYDPDSPQLQQLLTDARKQYEQSLQDLSNLPPIGAPTGGASVAPAAPAVAPVPYAPGVSLDYNPKTKRMVPSGTAVA